ncbi:hypothetical protein BT93_L5699 [Corymbia citriodora subsp. variegata]|uniref:Uncharacterized protein n=1 Tax=Corymbia citriodora subsp. variegata TaxID=360336 RepID=A0A8T0CRL5_CORYI|nr:hypothetical protein BT93_L5699 [Corymbia citriodora subsp. variegata]
MSSTTEEKVKKDEEIWRSRRQRMNNVLVVVRTVAQQDPAEVYAAVRELADFINGAADVEEFISAVERLAEKTDPSAIFNFRGPSGSSLLHVAAHAGKDDIVRLLVDYVDDYLIAAQDDGGDTPLHMAARAGGYRGAATLIRRARDLLDVEDKNPILRIKNRHGNTALHEAVICRRVDVVRCLLSEDLEPVYWKNAEKKSPLYLALDTSDSAIHDVLFSIALEPSRIQGLPPVHGAILRENYGTYLNLVIGSIYLCATTFCIRHDRSHPKSFC